MLCGAQSDVRTEPHPEQFYRISLLDSFNKEYSVSKLTRPFHRIQLVALSGLHIPVLDPLKQFFWLEVAERNQEAMCFWRSRPLASARTFA